MIKHPDLPRPCALIGVDWGTTSLRAFALDASGSVMARHDSADGILSIANGQFGAHLEDLLAPWVDAGTAPAIVLSGMITSRQGWIETPYLECPAPVAGLAGALQPAHSPSGWPLHFITGLSCRRADGAPDVMRGEETQVLGLEASDGLLVMPGTHSKWVELRAAAVAQFTTFMTGEVFAALREHSILGKLMTADGGDEATFERGVAGGLDPSSGLLARLFSVRTHGLFDDIPGDGLADYLSGLLIGTEFREALAAMPADEIVVLGRGDLVTRYTRAAKLAGVSTRPGPEDSAARGHYLVARAAGLLA